MCVSSTHFQNTLTQHTLHVNTTPFTMPAQHIDDCRGDYNQAVTNLLTDVDIASMHYSDTSMSSNTVHTVLKDLRPHREHLSKDRQRRFAAGELVADRSIDSDHDHDDLHEYDHWFIKANKKKLREAKLFLLER